MKNKTFVTISVILGFIAFIGIAFITNLFSSADLPVQFIGILLEAVVTALITFSLISRQTAQAAAKERQIQIYQMKIQVYSKFTKKMWEMFADNEITKKDILALQKLCFEELVFYLNDEQINSIHQLIAETVDADINKIMQSVSAITGMLQNDLNDTKEKEPKWKANLMILYNAFKKWMPEDLSNDADADISPPEVGNITYWHFNILNEEQQINAFKNGNWLLALIEYGEEWRTRALEQVQENDVVFLYKRGGSGYIGAFKATGKNVILTDNDNPAEEDIEKYDIYNGLADGATLCSSLLVQPIAYNYKGVGYRTVRRRTIERINDIETVKFLLTRFNGEDLDEETLVGMNRLDEKTTIENLDKDYFSQIVKQTNL